MYLISSRVSTLAIHGGLITLPCNINSNLMLRILIHSNSHHGNIVHPFPIISLTIHPAIIILYSLTDMLLPYMINLTSIPTVHMSILCFHMSIASCVHLNHHHHPSLHHHPHPLSKASCKISYSSKSKPLKFKIKPFNVLNKD